ncbi:hypothetical protein [Variovorax sp. PAMC26660]|uniref:hypothetical protein n=1 Tax=Variovorax sp. PAMC26660 TaxID=2762322 RepID=UPI00164E2AE9|nr:hypothetical protein [Variovorax sp. PAMC26660]QNK66817.1 hypothetical protein H7F35_27135 [Variovorax sp. PAMC26660]
MRRAAGWALVALVVAGVFFALRVIFMRHRPVSPGDWAAWVQAVFSVFAILASVGLVQWQQRLEAKRAETADAKQARRAKTDVVLMLQYVAAQLKRTNIFANYQLDNATNRVVYRDIAGEFRLLVGTLEKLPFSEVTLHGQLDTYLCLRRAADDLVVMYATDPQQGDGFYLANRGRLEELRKICSGFQVSLAEKIQQLDPVLYEQRKEEMLRL